MFKSSKNVVTTTNTEMKGGSLITSTRTVTTSIKTTGGAKQEVINESVVVTENRGSSSHVVDTKFPTSAFKKLVINSEPPSNTTSAVKSSSSTPAKSIFAVSSSNPPTVKYNFVTSNTPTVKQTFGSSNPTVKQTFGTSNPSTTKQSSGSSKSCMAFAQECLNAHNEYRSKHGVPPLTLNKSLCDFAQEWANKLASTNKFAHRPNNKYGENIFFKNSSDPNFDITGKEPVDDWYKEIRMYTTYRGEPSNLNSGHFTQVVWKSSAELGVGKAKHKGSIIVVANYNPQGNVLRNYKDNVLPPK